MVCGGEHVLLRYPAQSSENPEHYAPQDLVQELLNSGYYDQSADTIRRWATLTTHSTRDAKPRKGRSPLIVFLPGQGVLGFQYTILAEDLASHGYAIAVVDYFSPSAPKRSFKEDDSDALSDDMARAAIAVIDDLKADQHWTRFIRFEEIAIAGHSIGGSAALEGPRLDRRFVASIDMDGAPFGKSRSGTSAPAVILRSKPVYSDADLAKRGRSRAAFDKMGVEASKVWDAFRTKSTASVQVLSIIGTGHMSFSDSPFSMPDSISRFGGKIIDPQRSRLIVATCVSEFFDHHVRNRKGADRCTTFEETKNQ